jgi:MerR family transcriptional regulator, mercuric resistance operon regulatory protein
MQTDLTIADLTIGQLAEAAGVSVETVRYYQRRGLLREPVRPLRGIRRYSLDEVKRIRFIKRAQQLGFILEEVGNLLQLEDGRSCRETERLAEQKLALVEARIADLQRLRKTLKELIGRCEAGRGRISCPIIESLTRER